MSLRCLIVDDEPPAHKILENYIQKLEGLTLVGNCYNAIDALNVLHKENIDLVFLDINMPELSGLDMLRTLVDKPAVILTTAYSEFALEGYEFGVIDYLLKPIRFDRFLKAVNRLLRAEDKPTKPSTTPQQESPKPDAFFTVKADGIQHKVMHDELLYLESKGNFVQLHLSNRKILTANTLRKMDELLSKSGFLRVHKSYIVNTTKVKALEGNQLIIEGFKVPVGNSYKQITLSKLGF